MAQKIKKLNEFEALPMRVRLIINKCRDGERLQKTLIYKSTGETEISFTFEPSGRRAGPKSAQAAIKSPFMSPRGDGLFDASTSQTFAASKP